MLQASSIAQELQGPPLNQTAQAQKQPAYRDEGGEKKDVPVDTFWTRHGVRNVAAALVAGVVGAWAFYLGVSSGLISRNARKSILQHLETRKLPFWLCGGAVAAVFQAAQPSVFAPIQAFVLGASWPSVVSQLMSGQGRSQSFADLVDTDPANVPAPESGTTASDGQVMINPSTGT